MKRFNYYLGLILLLGLVASCHEEFDQPPVYIPVADAVPNMTIAEFKAKHWQESANYVDTVTENEVIHGWVTANDISNNIYRTVYISDGSAGLSISVSQNELYEKYRIGQEIVLPMKGHYVGKATGQLNVGAPYYYVNRNNDSTLECYYMTADELESLVQFNQLPNPSKVDTIDVNISDFQNKYDSETLLKYQGRLVRIREVEFVGADGKTPFADAGSSSTNRTIMDREGNTLLLRNSRSADFATNMMPLGRYDVVGVISFYQTNTSSTWQFYLRTIDDVIGEGQKGTKTYPYSVADAIELKDLGELGWVQGYIVGAVAPEVTTVSSNADIEWKAPTMLANTVVIADDPECKDYTKCIIVPLPQGSQFRESANLKDNPQAYKAPLLVKGVPASYMGMTGITENTGSEEEYYLDVPLLTLREGFDRGVIPGTWTNLAVSGTNRWGTYSYSSGGQTIVCAQMRITGTANQYTETWLITPRLDIKKAKSKVFNFTAEVDSNGNNRLEVYLLDSNDPTTARVKVKLNPNLPAKPTGSRIYSDWTPSGDIDLSDWADGEYYIGFNYTAQNNSKHTTWCIDDVTFGLGAPANRADFETMGEARGQYGTLTSTKGWMGTNCCLFQGGASDQNPTFQFIGYMPDGTTPAKAPTLNGKATAAGTLVSPVIKGGMSKLTFNYGAAMSDKLLSFRVDVKQNGSVIKSWTEEVTDVVQRGVYTFSRDINVRGDFTIEITNLCPSNSTSNKDRLSIWNLVWEPAD